MSPQRVATGPLCRGPSRPPLLPPGSHSGSEPSGGVARCTHEGVTARARPPRPCKLRRMHRMLHLCPLGASRHDPTVGSGCRFWRLGGGSSGGWRRCGRAAPSMRGAEVPHVDRGWEGRQPAATARLPWCGSPAADCTFIHGFVSVIHFTPLPVSPPLRLTAALPVAGPRDGGGGEERRRGRCRRAREPRPSRAGPAVRLSRTCPPGLRLSRSAARPPALFVATPMDQSRGEHIVGRYPLVAWPPSPPATARICVRPVSSLSVR